MERRKIKRYVPPAFFVMLAVSLVMWWLTQLVTVKVDGNIFDVECFASGSGYKLASHRILHRTEVEVLFDELHVTPSPVRVGWGIVDPEALTTIIARNVSDVKVERVGIIPEILLRGR